MLFPTVTIAAVTVFLYAWLVPLAVWGFMTWRQSTARQMSAYSFLETVCVYGYSLFIYIPTSVSLTIADPVRNCGFVWWPEKTLHMDQTCVNLSYI